MGGGEYGKTNRKGGNNHAEQHATMIFFTDLILNMSLLVSTSQGKIIFHTSGRLSFIRV
jgi:hypothetical protein